MPKREREVGESDVADSGFATLLPALESMKAYQWPTAQRSKLVRMLQEALQLDLDSYDATGEVPEAMLAKGRDANHNCDHGHSHGHDGDHTHHNEAEEEEDQKPPEEEEGEEEEYQGPGVNYRLWNELSHAKDHLRILVGPFATAQGADGAKPPEYESKEKTYEIDAFLYDDDDIDELEAAGDVSRNYCEDCGSLNIQPTRFISHSFSQQQLVYALGSVVPRLVAKESVPPSVLLDVGSRLGVVLLAAAVGVRPNIPHIVGVEKSKEFVEISTKLMQHHCIAIEGVATAAPPPKKNTSRQTWKPVQTQSTVSLRCIDALSEEGLLAIQQANIIVLNNVFEWYADSPAQLSSIWQQLRAVTQKPVLQYRAANSSTDSTESKLSEAQYRYLITNPSLADSLKPLRLGMKPKDFLAPWVQEVDLSTVAAKFEKGLQDDNSDDGSHSDGGDSSMNISTLHAYRVRFHS
jgi:hypothetical protein